MFGKCFELCVGDIFHEDEFHFDHDCYFKKQKNNSAGNLASMYYEQGNLDMAILHYNSAISCDAGFLEAYNNLVGNPISFACSHLVTR